MTAGNPAATWGVSVQRAKQPFHNHLYNQIPPSPRLPTHCKVLTGPPDSPNNPTTASSNGKMKAEEVLRERGSRIHGSGRVQVCGWAGQTDGLWMVLHRLITYQSTAGGKVCVCVWGGWMHDLKIQWQVQWVTWQRNALLPFRLFPPLHQLIIQPKNLPYSCARKQTRKVHLPILLSSTNVLLFLSPDVFFPLSSLCLSPFSNPGSFL